MNERDIAEQAYKNGYEAGKSDALKWVPVCDRLPTEEDANEEGTVLVRYIDEHPKYQLLEWELLWLCSRHISHWMPIPSAEGE